MHEGKRVIVQSWLVKAQHDLAAAKRLSADPDPLLDTAVFHCQQAAEKVVKGFLVYRDTRFPKTHDIEELITVASSLDTRLATWRTVAKNLTPYATTFRYPGSMLSPSRTEFDQALQDAEGLYHFVLSLLPSEVHP